MRKNNGNSRLSTGRAFRSLSAAAAAAAVAVTTIAGVFMAVPADALAAGRDEAEVVLRVCNWEEYIDLGDWDEEETIELESGDIIGENSMVEDFEEWYEENYGVKVKVE